jgi:hypothetical protein
VSVFAGAQNVANRENFSGVQWNRRLNRATINEQIGLFPILGVDWRF